MEEKPDACLVDNNLECLNCLDEASQPFQAWVNETIDNSRFGAWKRALRHRGTPEDKTGRKLQYFGVVTDATSRLSELFPTRIQDRKIYCQASTKCRLPGYLPCPGSSADRAAYRSVSSLPA